MKTILTLCLATLLYQTTFAQEIIEPGPTFMKINTNFQVGVPLNKFQETLEDVSFGAGFEILAKLNQMPIWAGVQSGFSLYDRETQKFLDEIGGIEREFEWKTRNNILLLHGMFRIQPEIDFIFQPYFNGMVGVKRFFTSTSLIDPDTEDGNLERFLDHSDWAISFGGALGIEIPLEKENIAVLDIRCSYFQGAHAEYYVRKNNPGLIEDTLDAFELKSSPTPLLLPQIGVTFNLNECSN